MVRGRKRQENSLTEVLSVRITKEQKSIILKNKWIKKELDKIVREYLNSYV